MSQENVDNLRRGFEAYARGDLDEALANLDPDVVAGIDAASHALGHAILNTTLGIYGHRDGTDLQIVMRPTPNGLKAAGESGPPENKA